MRIIDPHIHLFDLQLGQYDWLKDDSPPFWPDKKLINRSFGERDLSIEGLAIDNNNAKNKELAGFVHIEAGFDNDQPWKEIEWLESTCLMPFKSIAFADLTLPPNEFSLLIRRLQTYKSFVGVRHILDDQAVSILAVTSVNENLKLLADNQLIFELQADLICPRSFAAITKAIALAELESHTSLKVVINHAGLPPLNKATNGSVDKSADLKIEQHEFTLWLECLKKLSASPSVSIKCSGWEMLDRQYSIAQAITVIDEIITIFGESRVMVASNFPLCTLTTSYQEYWHQLLENLEYSSAQKKALSHDNAFSIYGF